MSPSVIRVSGDVGYRDVGGMPWEAARLLPNYLDGTLGEPFKTAFIGVGHDSLALEEA